VAGWGCGGGKPTDFREIDEAFFAGSRSPADNVADLQAQVAANRDGVRAMQEFAEQASGAVLAEQMEALFVRSARAMKEALGGVSVCEARDALDDGSAICVKLSVRDGLRVDFAGSAGGRRAWVAWAQWLPCAHE